MLPPTIILTIVGGDVIGTKSLVGTEKVPGNHSVHLSHSHAVAAALELDGGGIRSARIAPGGVAHEPWRAEAAERSLIGKRAGPEAFEAAGQEAVAEARPYRENGFKVEWQSAPWCVPLRSLGVFHESDRDWRTYVGWRYGQITNANLADYHVPVNGDIPEIEVSAIDIPDYALDTLDARRVGEIGITGTGAAVANTVFYATGKRIHDLPISLEKLL